MSDDGDVYSLLFNDLFIDNEEDFEENDEDFILDDFENIDEEN
jgi:hypothetical protein